MSAYILDCTLRDGGYYTNWDFPDELIQNYLQSMAALNVDFVEIGLRAMPRVGEGFRGGCAYSTERFLQQIQVPEVLEKRLAVMVNGAELLHPSVSMNEILEKLFIPADKSRVTLVRIACHVHEFEQCLPAASWLNEKGYLVGFNLMQIASQTADKILHLAQMANDYPIDVLYFADSMGSLDPCGVKEIISLLRTYWQGSLGIHTHDNMCLGMANTLAAIDAGVEWVDSTVTGMGRGPGNVQTEFLVEAISDLRARKGNISKLLDTIRKYFKPMQLQHKWGTNPFYYLSGKYEIHPTYVQEMLSDSRYSDDDILAALNYLRNTGGRKYSIESLEASRLSLQGEAGGAWQPQQTVHGREVLVLGNGPGLLQHKLAIEAFIREYKPYVIGLNTQKVLDDSLINARAACHPIRLLADFKEYLSFSQPLITSVSMLTPEIKSLLSRKEVYDYGIELKENTFDFRSVNCTLPSNLVLIYALAVAAGAKSSKVYLVGLDGYGNNDPRTTEIARLLHLYQSTPGAPELVSLTPTCFDLSIQSVYGL
ncbi:aldolase catalytic domain-containing protein [Nitrincola tapanii]|uniref:Homocitrate synthase n=1 Tax=Nitrincola tapanii TaxID=1708751 RepID=A0A5A9W1F5_9GAMM|nr:aldolase catalytic domain-containing protein [Nitrincola tapanii]KAA0874402.1 aldolase [Nitrincola tapanii]